MTFHEKLSNLRKLSINDPEVTDLLRSHIEGDDDIIYHDQSPYIEMHFFKTGITVVNPHYVCDIDIHAKNLINVFTYGDYEDGPISEAELSQITVEDIFYPDTVSLFDKLFNDNNYINSADTLNILRRFIHITRSCRFENDFVKGDSVMDDNDDTLKYGYFASNYFIILLKNNRNISININIFINNGDVQPKQANGKKISKAVLNITARLKLR